MSDIISYSIKPSNPNAHLFSVTVSIPSPANGQTLRMPAWIPGSYMIREFAKNVVDISAADAKGEVSITKVDKSSWQLGGSEGPVTVSYSVYAWDQSVRTAHLDQTHAYFNGTSVFLEVVGQAETACVVDIQNADIDEASDWRVATTLKEQGAERYGFGTYIAQDYDELIDHPVEIADFTLGIFDVCGVQHELVITGKHYADVDRICRDLIPICEHQIKFFGEPAPMDRYIFLTWVVGNGYGGLEHRSSTSLICKRDDLPTKHTGGEVSDDYQNFLGLCSHEYFHTWNVKRIKPAAFVPYNLNEEVHTPLLWAFEGITSYYDDLIVYRSGLITQEQYLFFLGKVFTRVLRGAGRLIQSAAESSFDTWTKFYKQDENSVNAIVSYYVKGAIGILAIDLTLRKLTDHAKSFDFVMKQLWQDYLNETKDGGLPNGVSDTRIQELVLDLVEDSGHKQQLSDLMDQVLFGTADFDYTELFDHVGVSLEKRTRTKWTDLGGKASASGGNVTPWLGANFVANASGAKISNVAIDRAASKAGLSSGDVVVAVDGIKASKDNIEKLFSNFEPGNQVSVYAFREDLLMQFEVTVEEAPLDTYYFDIKDEAKLDRWLKGFS